ncbi:flavodoxin domain-containing protein [Dactylosporangium sp. NBC_01737]|uniref:flavodoxin domain-containing protein n=1 Tax=Dactylosporangium sp. NBC_01737 TaxID=2975959 RepID=UPI002E1403DA|nr:flavodoxin domain-containing protein [Dactylosporangium sp. NBC_01737]
MRILITYADDDGAGADTARLIGDTLILHGFESVVRPVEAADADAGDFEAVVLGSTARAGHWLRRAVRFAVAQQQRLCEVPVWLFSNASPGDALTPEHAIDIGLVEAAVTPLDHRPFLATAAPALPWAPHALEPDPGEVCGWAHQIANTLQTSAASGT